MTFISKKDHIWINQRIFEFLQEMRSGENGNIYFAHDEKVYHIYYVVDTEEEAEEYVDYIADTIHQS